MDMIYCVLNVFIDWITKLKLNANFLSDIAAFEAVVIAFLVPLSIDIISKISDRYNSDVISQIFENDWANKILPRLLLVNIVLAIFLRFISQGDNQSLIFKIFELILFVVFVGVAFAILHIINLIKMYVSDTNSIINKLHEDIEASLE